MSDKGKKNKKKRKKDEAGADDIIKEKETKRPKYEEHLESTKEERNKKGKKKKDKKQKTDKKDKRPKKHKKTDGKNNKSVLNEEDKKEENSKEKNGAVRQPSEKSSVVDKTKEKNNRSIEKNNGLKKINKTGVFPLIVSKENSKEIEKMYSECSWNNIEKRESFEINLPETNEVCYTSNSVSETSKINLPETIELCYASNSVSETSKPISSTVTYYEVVRNPTVDLSEVLVKEEEEVEPKFNSDLPSNIMETLNENFFKNIVSKVFSKTTECTSLFKETTYVETNSINFFSSLKEDNLSGKGSEMMSDLEEEDSDKDAEDLETSNLETHATKTGELDAYDDITVEHEKNDEYREEESWSNIEKGTKEKLIEGAEVRKVERSKQNECFEEDELISKVESRKAITCMKKDEHKNQKKLGSQKECKQAQKEVFKFKQLLGKLDGYLSSVEISKDLKDKDMFISSIEDIYEKKKSTGSLSEVENSSYPELITAVRTHFCDTMKRIYESAFPLCKNSIQGRTNETVNADTMDNFLKCCDDYFLFFLKSIMTDSLACDNLFNTFVWHLKRSLSSFNKIHPFLLLVIFSNYPKSNCIMLCKFLNVCKVIFSVNFNCSYALPYLQNLKRFLLFSMLEVYHNNDVNNIHYLFRKEAARFYSDIILKYYSKEQKNVISYLKRILVNKMSKFCSCYGALCAIRAMGSEVEAEVIPKIFPFVIMKLKSVKRFAKENLRNNFETQFLFSSVKQTEVIAANPPESLDENQSETTEIHERPQSQDTIKNNCVILPRKKFDTLIPSENIYASLIREELLNACSQLSNKYVKNNLMSKKKPYLLSLNSNSVSSTTVEMFLEYFGQELQQLIPLKYASETLSQNSDIFIEKLIIDLRRKEDEEKKNIFFIR